MAGRQTAAATEKPTAGNGGAQPAEPKRARKPSSPFRGVLEGMIEERRMEAEIDPQGTDLKADMKKMVRDTDGAVYRVVVKRIKEPSTE
jgi:hypothetical protein